MQKLGDKSHDESKILNEAFVGLGHAIENLNDLMGFWWWHVDYCQNFLQIQ